MRKWFGCLCGRYEGRALPDASPSCYFRFSYYFSQMIFTGMIPVSSLLFSFPNLLLLVSSPVSPSCKTKKRGDILLRILLAFA